MLDSSIWPEKDQRDLFITALLMAEPFELREPAKQINVRSLDYTGFEVPIGWYGFVPAAGVGIIHRCGINTELGLDALEKLGSPDAESRSHDFEGRRLVRIDGGYLILNYDRFRERDYSNAERCKRYREKKKNSNSDMACQPLQHACQHVSDMQAEAEAEVESKKEEKAANAALSLNKKPTYKPPSKLVHQWSVAYREFFGKDYLPSQCKDESAAKRLMGLRGITSEEIIDIAKRAWAHEGFHCNQAVSISGFSSRFNEIRNELGDLKVKKSSKSRPTFDEIYKGSEI